MAITFRHGPAARAVLGARPWVGEGVPEGAPKSDKGAPPQLEAIAGKPLVVPGATWLVEGVLCRAVCGPNHRYACHTETLLGHHPP